MSDKKDEKIVVKVNNRGIFIYMLVITLIMVLAIGLSIFLFKKVDETTKELTKVKSTMVLKVDFQNVGKLVAQEATITVLKNYQNDRKLLERFSVPGTTYVYIFKKDYKVQAYVNFEDIQSDYDEVSKVITIKLPHAVLDEDVAEIKGSKEVLYDNKNLFNKIDIDKYEDAITEMKNAAKETAKKQGIIDKADNYTKILIDNMIKSNATYKDYSINYIYVD